MVPLCVVDDRVSVLFNVRSQQVTTHKGEVCFPGGHLDPSDECMEATANREFEEEVGVRVSAPGDRALWEQVRFHSPSVHGQSNVPQSSMLAVRAYHSNGTCAWRIDDAALADKEKGTVRVTISAHLQ
jgi:8-oxo-dGTP pyrophosphatase MutT (NUDIX family)